MGKLQKVIHSSKREQPIRTVRGQEARHGEGALKENGDKRKQMERGMEIQILVRTGRTIDTTRNFKKKLSR